MEAPAPVERPEKGDEAPQSVAVDDLPVGPPRFSPAWFKEALLGDYDYRYLCTPRWPYPWMCGSKAVGREPPVFCPVDEPMAFLPAAILGLQHCLAMLFGLITPASILGLNTDSLKTQLYLINASMIMAGLMTIIQSYGISHPKLPFQWGAGTLSVMGVSFTTVPIAQEVIPQLMGQYGHANSCIPSKYYHQSAGGPPQCAAAAFNWAWGKLCGTAAFCSFVPMAISFLDFRIIKRLFPPIVIGPVIMLIGINLIGAGFGDWGGGTFCAQRVVYNGYSNNFIQAVVGTDSTSSQYINPGTDNLATHDTTFHSLVAPRPLHQFYGGAGSQVTGLAAAEPAFLGCGENSGVYDQYGSAEFVGLGFLTFATIMAVEIFGSPFMRNCSCVIGLLWGYSAATWSRHGGQRYVTQDAMKAADNITFLWNLRVGAGPGGFFPLGFYPPLIIPLLIVFLITSCETWADTQASMEASRLDVSGKPLQIRRQKGALFNDTMSGCLSALAGVLPLTTFAQNNGVISLTAVAARRVGISAGVWLLIMGILAKIGAFIKTIPGPVLGGMTTFLFANVLASGMHILLEDPGGLRRRNRFIVAATMGVGVGVTIWPQWARNNLWPLDAHMVDGSNTGKAKRGVRDAIILILSTGFVFGFFMAFILNQLLPMDLDEPEHTVHVEHPTSEEDKEAMRVKAEKVELFA